MNCDFFFFIERHPLYVSFFFFYNYNNFPIQRKKSFAFTDPMKKKGARIKCYLSQLTRLESCNGL